MTEIKDLIAALQTESGPSYGDTFAELRTKGEEAVDSLVAVLAAPQAKETGDVAIILGKIAAEHPNAQPKALESLLSLFPRSENVTRISAARSLALLAETYEDICPRVIEALIEGLGDPITPKYYSIPAELARLGTPVIERLLPLLSSPNPAVRVGAATTLGHIAEKYSEAGEQLFEPLVALLKDENLVRAAAIESLGKLDDTRAADSIFAMIDDPDLEIHSKAMTALAQLNDARVIKPLIEAVHSNDEIIRQDAIEALGKFGALAVEPLLELVNEPVSRIRSAVFRALGETHDARVAEFMIDLLHGSDSTIYYDSWKTIRTVGTPAVPALLGLFNDPDPRMRAEAIAAFERIKDERAAQPLVAMLRDPERIVFVTAGRVLKGYTDLVLDSIIAMLGDPDPVMRVRVVQLLRDMKDARAVEPLIAMLNDKSEINGSTIAYDAAIALKFIGTPEAVAATADWDIKILGK